MSAPTMRSTSILTEHLQYPPISLVDDIINAVNEIMYKCTSAMEKYLLNKNFIEGKDYTSEIKVGIAKLETLLEHSVDKNFDKLELYILRNVLRIPQELLDNNVFRLKHQKDLVIANKDQIDDGVKELKDKVSEINKAFQVKYQLQHKLDRTKVLLNKTRKFKEMVITILECREDSDVIKETYNSLKPIDDSMKLLTSQLRQLYIDSEEYASMETVNNIIKMTLNEKNDELLNSRSDYIDSSVKVMLQENVDKQKSLSVPIELEELELKVNDIPKELDIEDPDLSVLE
ncbi:hypothetical protein Kpol_1065p11 [Vanderwaltozyma polyspora DSM 70294]|uniref:Uncharacterized protein n=1 Tax=Vanderwaltozyma polyspora (strain ATCC 22028 / DSM 70294 / BCRC 21397 / CBS 2163 / NBRC 10782 / NRRL Y-8283 / UCD 57-17) TaxID=436907 RepID=A7TL33_VANPO|nr:uncharacterized protein Kpol_1065p11 [Vanderwaltozyma polyspora DSM 70294]EDO16996.1 hypothetical protein Kpol_1065p11 [Vanderwaltozyma polyspora DSM 70294]